MKSRRGPRQVETDDERMKGRRGGPGGGSGTQNWQAAGDDDDYT